eukprot:Hpha_TRINITY_DN8539_c0_g1::TRINITY_DN8539_c0_g1_i1::g.146388::m.146388
MSERTHKMMRCVLQAALVAYASAATFRAGRLSGQSLEACIAGLKRPGDRCEIESGRYSMRDMQDGVLTVRGKHGESGAPMVITSASGDPADVVFDGTLPVNCSWKPYSSGVVLQGQRNGAAGEPYVCKLDGISSVNQLFVDEVMQVPARWPNARFDDKSMYMAPENWAHHKAGGEHDPVKTGKGKIVDAGACTNSSDCCSLCNFNDLARSGVNATGAIAIMNSWANGVGLDRIGVHTPGEGILNYDATWCKAEIIRRGKCGDGYRSNGRYYLEGTLNLLDANTEWYFDQPTRQLFLWTADGKVPKSGSVAYKAQTNAFEFYNSSFVTLANMTFFGTTLKAYDDLMPQESVMGKERTQLSHLTFESLDFVHPDSSKRMSGDLLAMNTTTVWTNDKATPSNHLFFGCSWRYADSIALVVQGNGNKIRSCTFEWNSWNSLCSPSPAPLSGNCGTLFPSGEPPADGSTTLDRVTFRFNGPSKCLRPSGGGLVTRIHFEGQLEIASDGCFVESGGSESAHLRYNWAFDSGKSALRFDGDDASGTANGEMSYNVAWNVSSFVVKGNNHTFSHNTAFDRSDIGPSFANHSLPARQTQHSDLDAVARGASLSVENPGATTETANNRSIFDHNLLESVENWKNCDKNAVNCPFAGTWKNNMVRTSTPYNYNTSLLTYFEVNSQLRWPWGRDFRPCPGSIADKAGAGAYPTYSPEDKQHWIPGALQRYPSMASPANGELSAIVDADLIFLPALRAVSHEVYFGTDAGKLGMIATLEGEDNVAQTPDKAAGTKYHWRVDTKYADGSSRTGQTWSFTTGKHSSCPAPGPAPAPPAPISKQCEAELDACCSDVKGQGDTCEHHINRHSPKDCTLEMKNRYCGLPPPS